MKPNTSRCAIEPAEMSDGKKTSAEEKDYDPGFGRVSHLVAEVLAKVVAFKSDSWG
jgi:hypothetical protein